MPAGQPDRKTCIAHDDEEAPINRHAHEDEQSASGSPSDCIIVGASFAGLACATVLARAGLRVKVVEKKVDVGEKLHTTGIIVKDAVDQIALLDALPPELIHRVDGVRLYAPNLRSVDLSAPGYYFLTTDTPNLMRWLAGQAEQAGVELVCGATFRNARREQSGFDLGELGRCRYLVGADGPRSRVARALGLGLNRQHLFGVEHEYRQTRIGAPNMLHCFVSRRFARGYIGWVASGPKSVQVGLARRVRGQPPPPRQAMATFLERIAPIFDFRDIEPASVRAGMIPCGGLVDKLATRRALLVGDAAGMVSPVTAGGIHTALKHGMAAGHAIADYLSGKREDPCGWFIDSYPRFRLKRLLRFAFDRFQSDIAFNLMLSTRLMRSAAGLVYFHHKGVFDSKP
ncbi:MAG: NAD(P)/FAD-dependent oxidoreductase [Rhodanobacteraceae bacterium]